MSNPLVDRLKSRTGTAVVIERREQVTTLNLPAGHRFVMLMLGHKPEVVPIDDPGTYTIDLPWTDGEATFPILIFTLPVAEANLMKMAGPVRELPSGAIH